MTLIYKQKISLEIPLSTGLLKNVDNAQGIYNESKCFPGDIFVKEKAINLKSLLVFKKYILLF